MPFTKSAITIDGHINEPAWKIAGAVRSFAQYKGEGKIANQTTVKLLYDNKALYLAFQCAERDMAALKANIIGRDNSVWDDDCVEIFLDPSASRTSFIQFALNTLGTQYDGLGNDSYGFNPKWQGKSSVGPKGWTAEIRIPFNEMGAKTPARGTAWMGNFCREEQPSKELSSWCRTDGSFGAPGSFGEIVFGSFADKLENDIRDLLVKAASLETTAHSLNVDSEHIFPNVRRSVEKECSRLSVGKPVTEADYLAAQSSLAEVSSSLRIAAESIRRAEMGNPEYIVWETTPWRHFAMKEDSSAVRQDTKTISAITLSGQTESRAVMVSNLCAETIEVRVLTSGFPARSVEVLFPMFVRATDGTAYPDALAPSNPASIIVIPPGETRQIWLNIKSSIPGVIHGQITINPLTASKVDKQIAVDVEVVGAPQIIAAPLSFTWDYLGDAEARGLETAYMQTMTDHGINVHLISGLRYMPRPTADDAGNFTEPVDWSRFELEVKLMWRPGRLLYINTDVWEKAAERPIYNGKFGSPGWNTAFKKIMTEMVGELTRLGLSYADYMVCPVDESIDERYITIARLIKEADPKIKIVEDTIGESLEQVKAADQYTDYWIPHFKSYFADSVKLSIDYMKSTGKPVGFYFYSEGSNEKARDSYHDYILDFWYAYSRGLNGVFGYWTATQHYGDPWNRHQTTADYDPSLFYYGTDGVVSGRRWEAWRQGLEDFHLLKTCEASGVDSAVISAAVNRVLDNPHDPNVAAKARETLLRSLMTAHH